MVRERPAFSLLELILVIGIIALLALALFALLRPDLELAASRNAKRLTQAESIAKAASLKLISGQKIPIIDSKWRMLGTAADGCSVECGDLGSPSASVQFVDVGNNRVQIPKSEAFSLHADTAFSVAAWVKPTDTEFGASIVRGDDDGNVSGWQLNLTRVFAFFSVSDDSGATKIYVTIGNFNQPVYKHVAISYDPANGGKIYINGVSQPVLQINAIDAGGVATPSSLSTVIGGASSGYDQTGQPVGFDPFPGFIDDVRLYHGAISDNDALRIMQGGEHTTLGTDLVGHWRFDEGAGSVVEDVSDNDYHGAIYDASWSTDVPSNVHYQLPDKCLNISNELKDRLATIPAAPGAGGVTPTEERTHYAIRYTGQVQVKSCLSELEEDMTVPPVIEVGR